MRLAARVARLEGIHKRVLRCVLCRYALRDRVPSQSGNTNGLDDVLPTKCWHCGTNFLVPLHGSNAKQREAAELIYNSHPTKQFIDERIHAASIWLHLSHSEIKQYERRKQEEADPERRRQTQSNPSYNRSRGSLSSIEEKTRRDREELKQRAAEFYQAQTERFKNLANGPESFPLDQTIEAIEKEFPTSGYDKTIDEFMKSLGLEKYSKPATHLRSALAVCNLHLQRLKKREACEVVLWVDPLPETLNEIRFFEEEKAREINEALAATAMTILTTAQGRQVFG